MLQGKYYNGVEILFLDEEKIFNKLKEIAEKIKKEKNKVKEIILFGSFAKNNFLPPSDIDILIILEESEIDFLKKQDEFVDYFSSRGYRC
jgi:predicted nucleotidyltransferase